MFSLSLISLRLISNEGIFIRFNCDIPIDYYGTSLSVSDVVVLKMNNVITAYYVDSFGFKKLENFEF